MDAPVVLEVREEKAPLWAVLAPLAYLLACAGCIRSVTLDSSIDVGISGLLVAVGLAPAFALPAIFSTRASRIAVSAEGLVVDGDLVKLNDIRLARADRGMARIHVETRNGTDRTFIVPSFRDAQRLIAALPPISAPAGAIAV